MSQENNKQHAAVQAESPRGARLSPSEKRLLEAFDELWDRFVSPDDAYETDDGLYWMPLSNGPSGAAARTAFADEQQLREIRRQCRMLAVGNEFAINGHENRINYIVGSGHAYQVTGIRGTPVSEELLAATQTVLNEFLFTNRWHKRQQEIVRRRDRDGEVFLRLFFAPDGTTRIRFIEPDQIITPPEMAGNPAASFGIHTDPDDVETVLHYYVDGRPVDAVDIQHRKANVDNNVKRGLPLFYPVRKNLRRAEKLLRNMSVLAEIQSAIAFIRKHHTGTKDAIQRFVTDQADTNQTNPNTGRVSHLQRYAPGTILDAFAGVDYDFPTSGIDASRFVVVLQAELRAIASRLVMPEFMLTSDASNANYSSTMVAEGPAVKMFDRLQHDMIEDDLALLRQVLRHAADCDRLPREVIQQIDIQAIPPTLVTRDRLKETQADQILLRNKILSAYTMARRHGLDPDVEQRNIVMQQTIATPEGDTPVVSVPTASS